MSSEKILILGDIHGKLIWYDIIQKENPDKIIFLGDYVTTHKSVSSEQQLSNLEDILNYKEEHLDKVILLRGNHDIQMLGYYWAECTGWDQKVYEGMIPMMDRFLSLTQWIYQIPDTNIICSHAGISEKFLDNVCKYFKSKDGWDFNIYDSEQLISHINDIEPCELFGFTPLHYSDYTGESETQPCTWIRPYTLLRHGLKDIIHIVGHTPVSEILNLKERVYQKSKETFGDKYLSDIKEYAEVWCCDCLEDKQYLIIENNKFIPKILN